MADGIFLLELTTSQRIALIDILLEHLLEPRTSKHFVDIAADKTTTHDELLLLLDRAAWFTAEKINNLRKLGAFPLPNVKS